MLIQNSFEHAIAFVAKQLKETSYSIHPEKWQGMSVAARPEAEMREILNVSFTVPLAGNRSTAHWRGDICPNLPWADLHFEERVCGKPLNPGETWKQWPWALAADKHRTQKERFTHTYMQRYWATEAGTGVLPPMGLMYEYGDLWDVVTHLAREPMSRQAFLPVWFPEDTGVKHGGRVPCTLGYHWLMRHNTLHTTYYIRSCDFYRHFRDDLYLSVRLTLWLLEQLRGLDSKWGQVKPGLFTFHCVSMHLFIAEYRYLFGTN